MRSEWAVMMWWCGLLTERIRYDFTNKRVGVIGAGSSAIQIIPSLQRLPGTQLSCFIRSRTWISPPFGQEMWDKLGLTSFISI